METISIELAKNITEVMMNFDFPTTVEILKFLNIKWKLDNGERYPTLDDVQDLAQDLLWKSIEYAYKYKENSAFSESGCFRAEYHKEDNEEYVELMFEPCSWRKIA